MLVAALSNDDTFGASSGSFSALLRTFFFASAAASSAYLTVSEVFPLETRAKAIAFFYAIATGIGGAHRADVLRQGVDDGGNPTRRLSSPTAIPAALMCSRPPSVAGCWASRPSRSISRRSPSRCPPCSAEAA